MIAREYQTKRRRIKQHHHGLVSQNINFETYNNINRLEIERIFNFFEARSKKCFQFLQFEAHTKENCTHGTYHTSY